MSACTVQGLAPDNSSDILTLLLDSTNLNERVVQTCEAVLPDRPDTLAAADSNTDDVRALALNVEVDDDHLLKICLEPEARI